MTWVINWAMTLRTAVLSLLMPMMLAVLVLGCDSNPPPLMPAVKQFQTEEQKSLHVADMRSNHMHRLTHKRDETMYQGIRTPKHSFNACINCHVPAPTTDKVVKHTDPEHFCATCHIEVAVKLDCFQCHADRPAVETAEVVKP
jgi:hypothetical protein